MIAIVGRGSAEPAPRLTRTGSGAPRFAVQFSRPRAVSGRWDSRANTFRWTGPGTIHILERGMLVVTRRRSPLGFRTADERFVPAAEICEVFRSGDSVRVDLRGEATSGGFFQFWTDNAATAGTIVRLLPTTRTIEYEGPMDERVPAPRPPLSLNRRRWVRRRFVSVALAVGLVAVAALLVTDIKLRRTTTPGMGRVDVPAAGSRPAVTTPLLPASSAEVANALAEIRRFDDRMDGLKAQYRTAFGALQSGQLSQDEFVDGINRWLIPQWRALSGELAARARAADGALTSLIRGQLMSATLDWGGGLQDYAEGLRAHSYNAVIAAFDRMSNGNESRREAWRMLDRAEIELATRPPRAAPQVR